MAASTFEKLDPRLSPPPQAVLESLLEILKCVIDFGQCGKHTHKITEPGVLQILKRARVTNFEKGPLLQISETPFWG